MKLPATTPIKQQNRFTFQSKTRNLFLGFLMIALGLVVIGDRVNAQRQIVDDPNADAVAVGGATLLQVESPTTRDLRALSTLAPNNIWAVGGTQNNGRIIQYDGQDWNVVAESDPILFGIAMISGTDGWAVGQGGTILRYQDGLWLLQESPTTRDLRALSVVAANDIWAVGGTPGNGRILHFDGRTWDVVLKVEPILFGIAMTSANEGWAVGQGGTVLRFRNGEWRVMENPTSRDLFAVAAVSPDNVFAVGENGRIVHYDGTAWTAQDSPTTRDLRGVSVVAPNNIWAVGGTAENGRVLRFNGTQWDFIVDFDKILYGIDGNQGWIVGERGTILRLLTK
jgi:photosystem II stability/assembly factor-like uncharacterized protein